MDHGYRDIKSRPAGLPMVGLKGRGLCNRCISLCASLPILDHHEYLHPIETNGRLLTPYLRGSGRGAAVDKRRE